ncbi:plasmid partition protein ParG (plasmid) [Clavibacter michiganensis]|uniref:plasmid partition protein ParG n=1 Tax=Clavibacter michiganensis TaxID=28447 RepID=UPI003DA145EE
MAQISMAARAAAIKPVPPAPTAVPPASAAVSPVPPADTGASSAAPAAAGGSMRRINFELPRERHAAFKAWCAQNDTTMKDELEAHIMRVLGTQYLK